jgi:hypothetical protein
VIYLDSSAIVKLIAVEPESAALDSWLASTDAEPVTSQFALAEVARALGRRDLPTAASSVAMLGGLAVRAGARAIRAFPATPEVLVAAGTLGPPSARSLDAVHVATALALGPSLAAFLTYDSRQADAARAHGLAVRAPA